MYTKGELKTLGDVWAVFERHGLEGKYCPHCDQFAQAKILQEHDEIISDLYEACKAAFNWYYRGSQGDYRIIGDYLKQALAKADGK